MHIIRQAETADVEKIADFLNKAEVTVEGLEEWLDYFLLMETEADQTLIGTIGIEPFEKVGLLRSMVLSKGTVEDILFLIQQALKLAKEKDMDAIYCGVNNHHSIQLFQLLGFQKIDMDDIPQVLKESNAVKSVFAVDKSHFMYIPMNIVNK
ncbi:GNAT family N-acetyltransferase [Niallia sp. JL1B1071]|uniref:GNAT family N-acetyltransferase n=1 Tax=Niallia tiangongensis TaxID=3237105 RepID=UPI0037DDCC76